MALTLGSGPFSKQRSSADANYEIEGPEHLLLFEDYPRRMRALLGGETVVDSERGKLLFESNIPPVLYLPEDDLAPGVTESTSHATHCPFKGDAAYWSLKVGDRVAENAVWGYPEPGERARWLKGSCRSTGTPSTSGSRRTSRSSGTCATPTTVWTCARARAASG